MQKERDGQVSNLAFENYVIFDASSIWLHGLRGLYEPSFVHIFEHHLSKWAIAAASSRAKSKVVQSCP